VAWLDFNEANHFISLQTAPHHSIFTGQILFLTPNQQRRCTEGSRMLIHWFANTSFKPQVCEHCSTNCCYLSTAFSRE